MMMPVDRRKIALYVVAANLRLVVFLLFPGIPGLLTGQVEVSTPVSSFKRRMPIIESQSITS
jgi:phosphatidylinositol glycan class U